MFAINFIVLLDILELNLMPLLSRQRYFFRMISQYNFIALLVAQLSSITLVKRTMHFTMIMCIKACNFCYGSSILTRIYTMPLTSEGRELCRKLFEQWNDMANFDKREAIGYLICGLNHLKQDHRMRKWPIRFLRIMYRNSAGGKYPMRRKDVSKLIILFLGNGFELWCISTYILLQIVASDISNKSLHARLTIRQIVNTHEAALKNSKLIRYYDLGNFQWRPIDIE